MTTKERTRHEISEAFDFVRFLINHPEEIKRIKNGSEINIFCKEITHIVNVKRSKQSRFPQFNYLSERTFHRV